MNRSTPLANTRNIRKPKFKFIQPGHSQTYTVKTSIKLHGFEAMAGDDITVQSRPFVAVGAIVAVRLANGIMRLAEFHPQPNSGVILKSCSDGQKPQLWLSRDITILGTPEMVKRNGEVVWMSTAAKRRMFAATA